MDERLSSTASRKSSGKYRIARRRKRTRKLVEAARRHDSDAPQGFGDTAIALSDMSHSD